ncbi:MAG: MgtC/SapB family protein, partial [Chloroflexi bacterium]|nr:MgtC/SapB family protein [Chloroflexota bacterium]
LICLGSALFMITGELVTRQFVTLSPAPDPTRIGSTIVTGVGFLGAGIIFQGHGRVRNLTTAATIWVIAAIGMLAGAGIYIVATTATVITLLVLTVLTRLEDWMVQRGIAASDESANATETPAGPPPGA